MGVHSVPNVLFQWVCHSSTLLELGPSRRHPSIYRNACYTQAAKQLTEKAFDASIPSYCRPQKKPTKRDTYSSTVNQPTSSARTRTTATFLRSRWIDRYILNVAVFLLFNNRQSFCSVYGNKRYTLLFETRYRPSSPSLPPRPPLLLLPPTYTYLMILVF